MTKVRFMEMSALQRVRLKKVNMKSTICQDVPSPDLLEGPKDRKIQENGEFFFHSKDFKQGSLHYYT